MTIVSEFDITGTLTDNLELGRRVEGHRRPKEPARPALDAWQRLGVGQPIEDDQADDDGDEADNYGQAGSGSQRGACVGIG